MMTVDLNRIDTNNMKALAILNAVLFALMTEGDCMEFDVVSALEAVRDYLTDTNELFNNI